MSSSMAPSRGSSFEGRMFFVYDREAVKKEEDPPEDAIIYFYPHAASIDDQVSICGQLVGMSNFISSFLGAPPALFKLKTEKVAVYQSGQYSLALGGSLNEPDSLLIRQLETLYNVFAFYHGSTDNVRKNCREHSSFLSRLTIIWDCYLPFVRHYGDTLPAVFDPLPFLDIPKKSSGSFLKASHILQACQRRYHILGGCILYSNSFVCANTVRLKLAQTQQRSTKRHTQARTCLQRIEIGKSVLCTHLDPSITKRLLLLKPNQSHHPAKEVKTEINLPFGVRILNSFVTLHEYQCLVEALSQSPYRQYTAEQANDPNRTTVMSWLKPGNTIHESRARSVTTGGFIPGSVRERIASETKRSSSLPMSYEKGVTENVDGGENAEGVDSLIKTSPLAIPSGTKSLPLDRNKETKEKKRIEGRDVEVNGVTAEVLSSTVETSSRPSPTNHDEEVTKNEGNMEPKEVVDINKMEESYSKVEHHSNSFVRVSGKVSLKEKGNEHSAKCVAPTQDLESPLKNPDDVLNMTNNESASHPGYSDQIIACGCQETDVSKSGQDDTGCYSVEVSENTLGNMKEFVRVRDEINTEQDHSSLVRDGKTANLESDEVATLEFQNGCNPTKSEETQGVETKDMGRKTNGCSANGHGGIDNTVNGIAESISNDMVDLEGYDNYDNHGNYDSYDGSYHLTNEEILIMDGIDISGLTIVGYDGITNDSRSPRSSRSYVDTPEVMGDTLTPEEFEQDCRKVIDGDIDGDSSEGDLEVCVDDQDDRIDDLDCRTSVNEVVETVSTLQAESSNPSEDHVKNRNTIVRFDEQNGALRCSSGKHGEGTCVNGQSTADEVVDMSSHDTEESYMESAKSERVNLSRPSSFYEKCKEVIEQEQLECPSGGVIINKEVNNKNGINENKENLSERISLTEKAYSNAANSSENATLRASLEVSLKERDSPSEYRDKERDSPSEYRDKERGSPSEYHDKDRDSPSEYHDSVEDVVPDSAKSHVGHVAEMTTEILRDFSSFVKTENMQFASKCSYQNLNLPEEKSMEKRFFKDVAYQDTEIGESLAKNCETAPGSNGSDLGTVGSDVGYGELDSRALKCYDTDITDVRGSLSFSRDFGACGSDTMDFRTRASDIREFKDGESDIRDFGNGASDMRDFRNGASDTRDFGNDASGTRDFGNGASDTRDFGNDVSDVRDLGALGSIMGHNRTPGSTTPNTGTYRSSTKDSESLRFDSEPSAPSSQENGACLNGQGSVTEVSLEASEGQLNGSKSDEGVEPPFQSIDSSLVSPDEPKNVDDDRWDDVYDTSQVDGMVHINLYVQAHSDIVLILLAEPALHTDHDTIKALWKTTLNELGELEFRIQQALGNPPHPSLTEDHSFLVYDGFCRTMKGNLREPVLQVDHVFCDTAKTVHEHFNNSESLRSITLRGQTSAVYGQRSLDQEVYYQKKGSFRAAQGVPTPRDPGFNLERRASKLLHKEHGVNIF